MNPNFEFGISAQKRWIGVQFSEVIIIKAYLTKWYWKIINMSHIIWKWILTFFILEGKNDFSDFSSNRPSFNTLTHSKDFTKTKQNHKFNHKLTSIKMVPKSKHEETLKNDSCQSNLQSRFEVINLMFNLHEILPCGFQPKCTQKQMNFHKSSKKDEESKVIFGTEVNWSRQGIWTCSNGHVGHVWMVIESLKGLSWGLDVLAEFWHWIPKVEGHDEVIGKNRWLEGVLMV